MKITICGSLSFSKQMLEAKEKLEQMGHQVEVPEDAQDVVLGKHDNNDLQADLQLCIERDIMRRHYKKIEDGDAVLILNYDKNNVRGYVGASSLIELGMAYYFHKKIFLLNEPPHFLEQRWAHEVRIMQPTVIGGDLNKIA